MSKIAEWANDLDWDAYIDDSKVQEIVKRIKERVETLDAEEEGDEDLEDAPRVKLVIVGDGAVGKTCLLVAYETGNFPEEYVPTVFENVSTTVTYKGIKVLLQLWDTAGQEDYDRLRPLSYPGTDVVLLCYSVMNDISYEAIEEKWAPEINQYVPDAPKVLVGTKVDLRDAGIKDPHCDDSEPVTKAQGDQLAKDIEAAGYVEASAKTGKNLKSVFELAIKVALEHKGEHP